MFSENPVRQEVASPIESDKGPTKVVADLINAINNHDLNAMAACFDPRYESEFPVHPDRSFRGHDQMLRNWSQIFAAIPDIKATMLSSALHDDSIWNEWEWSGTRRDGVNQVMRGVTIQGVKHGKIVWVRLYMEPVQVGSGADAAIQKFVASR